MSDRLREFERLLSQRSALLQDSSVETLLAAVSRDVAQRIRLCAIPHEFDPEVLKVLEPELDDASAHAAYEQLTGLACVIPSGQGARLHESARRTLFRGWLDPSCEREFKTVSDRLAGYFEQSSAFEDYLDNAALHRVTFHRIGVDQARGFAEFERLCREARHQTQFTVCGHLIQLVHEYDAVLAPGRKAWLTYHEGKLAADLLRSDEAESLFEATLAQASDNPRLQAKVYLRLGRLSAERRHFDRAVEFYARARPLAGPAGVRVYDIERSLGEAYRDLGNLDEAETLLTRSLEAAQASDDLAALADIHNSLGTLNMKRGDFKEAVASYAASLEHLTLLGRRFQSAQVYNNLGIAYADQGEFGAAEEALRTSLAIKGEAGDSLGRAKTLINLARIHRSRGELTQASDACSEAARLFAELQHLPGLASPKRNLGKLQVATGSIASARELLDEAATLFDRCGLAAQAAAARAERQELRDEPPLRRPEWKWRVLGTVVVIGFIVLVGVVVAALVRSG